MRPTTSTPQQEYRREMGRRTRICISKNNKTETSKVGAISMAQKTQNIFSEKN